ncbi:MAG: Hint domain-containing protein [Pseudomonadota bacterium]
MAEWNYSGWIAYELDGGTYDIDPFSENFDSPDTFGNGLPGDTFSEGDLILNDDEFYVGTITVDGVVVVLSEIDTTIYLNVPEGVDGNDLTLPNSIAPEDINTSDFTVCFLAGTGIATPIGEVAVEALSIGDWICTADGGTTRVKWIGVKRVLKMFGCAERLHPIEIKAHAFGPNLPIRDLGVSADHGMAFDGVIVHVGALVNGTTVIRRRLADLPDVISYYHIETERHEIVLANGCPAETFVDNVTRATFDNYAEYEVLYGAEAEVPALDMPRVLSARQLPQHLRALQVA